MVKKELFKIAIRSYPFNDLTKEGDIKLLNRIIESDKKLSLIDEKHKSCTLLVVSGFQFEEEAKKILIQLNKESDNRFHQSRVIPESVTAYFDNELNNPYYYVYFIFESQFELTTYLDYSMFYSKCDTIQFGNCDKKKTIEIRTIDIEENIDSCIKELKEQISKIPNLNFVIEKQKDQKSNFNYKECLLVKFGEYKIDLGIVDPQNPEVLARVDKVKNMLDKKYECSIDGKYIKRVIVKSFTNDYDAKIILTKIKTMFPEDITKFWCVFGGKYNE